MNPADAPFLILGMALLSFAARYPVLVFVQRVELPQAVVDALRFVPVAILMAMVAPAILMPDSSLDFGAQNPYLVAGMVAVGVAWWKKRLLLTLGVGMAAFFLWQWFVAGR